MRAVRRILGLVALAMAGWLGALASCQHRFIYFPRAYQPATPAAFLKRGGIAIETRTAAGRQVSWLWKPADGVPERLWVVCGGNGSLALEMDDIAPLGSPRDAYLFFDYPGYGRCEGRASPDSIRDSLRATVPAAAAACWLKPDDLRAQGVVLGHSIGAAVALVAADEFGLRHAVLVSPFTSTMDMARVMTGLPVGWLVRHRFDNRAALRALERRGGRAWIVHGIMDEVIPVEMGRTLAREFPATTTLREVPDAGHNDIFLVAPDAIAAAMAEARGRE